MSKKTRGQRTREATTTSSGEHAGRLRRKDGSKRRRRGDRARRGRRARPGGPAPRPGQGRTLCTAARRRAPASAGGGGGVPGGQGAAVSHRSACSSALFPVAPRWHTRVSGVQRPVCVRGFTRRAEIKGASKPKALNQRTAPEPLFRVTPFSNKTLGTPPTFKESFPLCVSVGPSAKWAASAGRGQGGTPGLLPLAAPGGGGGRRAQVQALP